MLKLSRSCMMYLWEVLGVSTCSKDCTLNVVLHISAAPQAPSDFSQNGYMLKLFKSMLVLSVICFSFFLPIFLKDFPVIVRLIMGTVG